MSHQATRKGGSSQISRKPSPSTAVRILTDQNNDSVHTETPTAHGIQEPLENSNTKSEHDVDNKRRPPRVAFWSRCRSKWTRFRLDTWLQELFSIAISFICLVALAILLFRYDQKPLRDWKLSITLNAVISIIVTIMDAALALPLASGFGQLKWILLKHNKQVLQKVQQLDCASRSTMGSLSLLLSLRGSIVGSVGAVLAILMLAIGPFVQQVVSISFKGVMTGQASIGRALNGTGTTGDLDFSPSQLPGESYYSSVPLPMRAAYYNALFGFPTNGRLPDPSFTCPSGNCTWDPFVSLAICSECNNIAELVQRTKWKSVSNSSNKSYVSWALPRTYHSLNISIIVDEQYSSDPSFKMLHERMNMTSIWNDTKFDRSTLEYSFLTIALLNGSSTNPLEVTALECSLRMCLNKVEARVENGNYTENRTAVTETVPDYSSAPLDEGYLVPSDLEWEGTAYMINSYFVWELQGMLGNMFIGGADNYRGEWDSGDVEHEKTFRSDVLLAVWDAGNLPAQLE